MGTINKILVTFGLCKPKIKTLKDLDCVDDDTTVKIKAGDLKKIMLVHSGVAVIENIDY